jgi:hypothetical protein
MKQIILAVFLLAFASIAFSQTPSGVAGVVTDASGAVIPGVTVTLTDTRTNTTRTTVTTDDGTYRFTNVTPGPGYRIAFNREGFQSVALNGVQISVATTETQDAQLTAGQVSATVEITSTTGEATLNTTDASIGNVIGSRQLRELPIQIRSSPAALIGLQPGAIGNNVGTGGAGNNITGSIAGARADQSNITVDGIDANDVTTGQAFATVANAPIDSIQEFRGTVAGQDASAGRSGGQIQLKTNSGTNRFSGNLREYYRNENTAANAFFNNVNGVTRPRLRRHQYGGSLGGPLPFFNFGENSGGPMFHSGKDKLFFFTDVEIRRDRSQTTNARTVPLASFRNGQIGYIRQTNAQTGTTCTTGARANDPATAGCIAYLTPAEIAAIDPRGVGVNSALLGLYNSRFPLPNDLTGGDGVNTGVYRFNSPNLRDDRIITTRFDAVPTDRQRLFVRYTNSNIDSTNTLQFLPQDEDAQLFQDRSIGIAVGHTWIITPNLSNVLTLGLSRQVNLFSPPSDLPSFPYSFSGGTIGAPYPSLSYQDRHVNTPTYRDDVTWTRGSHTFQAGVSFKPVRQESSLILDFNFVTLGLAGGGLASLNTDPGVPSLRPANLLNNTTAISRYDTALTTILGRISSVTTNFNYNAALQPLAAGTGKTRNYAYDEYEGYLQDNWRITNNLTLNLGVRYALYPAPYETNGILATQSTDYRELLARRLANADAGISGNAAEPFLVYDLAGKANNAAPLYQTDRNNFAPRIGFAYAPSGKGFLGRIFGERKTSIRGSYDMTYDRVSGALLFIQNQFDYLFQNSDSRLFGALDARQALLNDPRFTAINSVPTAAITAAPTVTRPYTPFVDSDGPFGTETNNVNYAIDQKFKTPFSHLFSFGIQRELPGNHLIDVSYVGRLGRDLFVQSDVAQVTNFKDPASGQRLFDAFNQVQSVLAACAPNLTALQCRNTLPAIPFFENQVGAAALATYGLPCTSLAGAGNCTRLAVSQSGNFFQIGDTSDAIQGLLARGLLNRNVGLSAQFASNAYVTNQGNSDYHGMLVSLQKRFSRGFEYDINYTFSKSLDNQSSIGNTVFGGLICDVTNPDLCRGPSAFDVRHLFNANFIADLPFGRGRAFGGNMNRFVDAFLGGWTVSGIISARSGLPVSFSPSAGSFPIGYQLASPAIVIGNPSAFAIDIRDTPTGIQFFADPAAAQAAIRDPHHGELGSRNAFRGPGFWSMDMGLSKRFTAPWSEKHRFTIRADAFNVTNTPQFAIPNLTRLSSNFGIISGNTSAARVIQFGARYDF